MIFYFVKYFIYLCALLAMEEKNREIRFGIMVDGMTVEEWQHDTIKLLIDNGIELALIVENADESRPYKSFSDKILHYPYSRILFRIWNRFFFKPKAKMRVPVPFRATEGSEEINKIKCHPVIKGISSYFSYDDIAKIKSYNLDFILRFGFDIVRGGILESARYGVWSFHHDDERVVRGGPPGFWEFMRKIPQNGVILQQLTDKLDKGLILKRIQLDTALHSYKYHLNRLLVESEVMPLQVVKELIINGNLAPEQSQSKAPILHPPKNFQMLRYFWLYFWRKIVFHYKYLFRQEDWNVGYCMVPTDDFVNSVVETQNFPSPQWLKPPKSDYFADPFVITAKDDTYLFFEWFSNKNGKADLTVAKKSEDFAVYHKISDFPEHRSYPYIFEYQDVIYCIPEAYKTGKVTLYRFENDKLVFDSDLLENEPFVDTTLHYHNDKWYLFTTPQKKSHTHLLIYVADDLRGPYRPHFNNPVKVDCHNSRPAGKILNINGELIRPAQNSTRHYGESITLNKIVQLSEYQYIEEEIKEIKPFTDTSYCKGIHTINGNEFMTVFDAKRFTFTWRGFLQQIKQ